jgi:tetratricopeptide (TPR) repeat protein
VTTRYLAVVFSDLERHSLAWTRVPRDRMVAVIAEYRYLAESLAGQYGSLYFEWAGDGHMVLFESVETAVQFGLELIAEWQRRVPPAERDAEFTGLPLRLGCHFGECTQMDRGEGWIGRANAVAKRAESEAAPNSLYVTESVLDLIDLPLYSFEEAGSFALKGDHLRQRALFSITAFDRTALGSRPEEELAAEDWFRRALALIRTDLEDSDDEAECYRQALRLRPDYPEAHNNLAVLLYSRGEQSEAARHYQEALRLRPDYAEAHSNYASLLAARGSAVGAAEHFAEALRLRPDFIDAHHGYASFLARRGDSAAAAESYAQVLALRPDYPEAHSNYAIALEDLGRLEEAALHYREALRLHPEYSEAHYNFALLLEREGETSAAEEHYRRAVELWPDYAEAHNNLGALLHVSGRLAEAEPHYRRALELRPEDPETHYNLGLLLQATGDAAGAERHFRAARELSPEEPMPRSEIRPPV